MSYIERCSHWVNKAIEIAETRVAIFSRYSKLDLRSFGHRIYAINIRNEEKYFGHTDSAGDSLIVKIIYSFVSFFNRVIRIFHFNIGAKGGERQVVQPGKYLWNTAIQCIAFIIRMPVRAVYKIIALAITVGFNFLSDLYENIKLSTADMWKKLCYLAGYFNRILYGDFSIDKDIKKAFWSVFILLIFTFFIRDLFIFHSVYYRAVAVFMITSRIVFLFLKFNTIYFLSKYTNDEVLLFFVIVLRVALFFSQLPMLFIFAALIYMNEIRWCFEPGKTCRNEQGFLYYCDIFSIVFCALAWGVIPVYLLAPLLFLTNVSFIIMKELCDMVVEAVFVGGMLIVGMGFHTTDFLLCIFTRDVPAVEENVYDVVAGSSMSGNVLVMSPCANADCSLKPAHSPAGNPQDEEGVRSYTID